MGLHFLIVDDSSLNLTVISSLLKKLQITCDCVTSANDAYELISGREYNMIILDYMMPDINGIEAAEYIRNMSRISDELAYCSSIPIIVLTAEDNFNANDYKKIINGYISKPIRKDALCFFLNKYFPAFFKNGAENSENSKEFIDGIDAKASECIEYLQIFIENCDNITQTIKMSLQISDYTTYTIEVHRLKGEAQIISATALSEAAKELECAGKTVLGTYNNGLSIEENKKLIDDKTPKLLSMLKKLQNDINEYESINGITSSTSEVVSYDSEKIKQSQEADTSSKLIISVSQRDKVIRYLDYAIESINANDGQNAVCWLEGIKDLLT